MRLEVDGSTAESYDLGYRSELYVVHNDPLRSLLFNRSLTGIAFRNECLSASRLFVRHLAEDLSSGEVVELVLLSKGLVYQLAEAFAQEMQENLPQNIMATSRVSVEADTAKIDVPYSRLDAGGSCLLIGDTVASGATIIAALEEYRSVHLVEKVYLISYAGTISGARTIAEFCERAGIALTMTFGLGVFGLGENGFDISFLHPDTIARQEYKARASALYGGSEVSAAGWDFGTQSMAPEKYKELSWIEMRLAGLGNEEVASFSKKPMSLDPLWREQAAFSARASELDLELRGRGDDDHY